MTTLSRRSIRRAALLAGLAGLPTATLADQTFHIYRGPSGGSWTVPSNWEQHGVPDVAGEVPIIMGDGYVVLSGSVTVDKIGMYPGAVIGISNGSMLAIRTQHNEFEYTGIFGGGLYGLSSAGSGTYIRFVGAPGSHATFGDSNLGLSRMHLSATTANIIDGSAAGIIFYNEGIIEGAGQVGANTLIVNNTGTIRATHPGVQLIIDPPAAGFTNNAVLSAEGGYLNLTGGTFNNLGAGALYVGGDTSLVDITAATIVGGELKALAVPSQGFRAVSGSQFIDVTLNGPMHVPNAHLMYLTNTFSTGTGGHLHLDSIGSGTYIRLTNNVELTGLGTIEMSNISANIIDGQTTGLVLTNSMPNGIVGSGQLGNDSLEIVNHTNIYASGSSGLVINPSAAGLTNNGHLWALTGSTLTLTGGTFNNAGHFIEVQPNATCVISAATVSGGTLQSFSPGGSFSAQSNSQLNGITIAPASVLNVPNAHLNYLAGMLTNNGTMNLNSVGSGTYFRSNGDYTLSGTGVLFCSNTTANIMDANVTGQRLTNASTIRGSCSLGNGSLNITNNGTLEGFGSQGMYINPGPAGLDNNATIRALTGSFVTLANRTFDNADGVVEVQDGASGVFSAARIAGGTLRTLGSGVFSSTGSSILQGVTIEGTLSVPNANLTYLEGTITNNGTMSLNSIGSATYYRSNGDYAINGTGVLLGSNTTANILDANVTGQRLTLNSTIRGACSLGNGSLAVTNNGLIEASASTGIYISIPAAGFDNNATVRALTGSSVTIVGSTFDNTGGLVEIQNGAVGVSASTTMMGGTIRTLGTGVFNASSNSVLQDLTVEGTLAIPNANLAYVRGTITNNGTIALNSIGSATYMRTLADHTLTGSGTVIMSNTAANIIDANVTGQTLTTYNTIRGSGQIGQNALNVINHGSIIADQSGGIYIDPPASPGLVNAADGVIRVQGAGVMTVYPGAFTNAGTITVDPTRLLQRSGDLVQTAGQSIIHGELQCDGGSFLLQGGRLGGNGLVDTDLSNTGGTLAPGASAGSLTIEGAYSQGAAGTMEIELAGPEAGQFDHLAVTTNASLAGALSVKFLGGYSPVLGAMYRFLDVTGTRTGTFATITLTGAPFGVDAIVQYDAHGAVLVLTQRCGLADFDGDGDAGTDFDIEAFFACLAGNCCPTCGVADFDYDGDTGTDADIEAFFSVLAGGGC